MVLTDQYLEHNKPDAFLDINKKSELIFDNRITNF